MKFGFLFVASTWVGVPICAALGLSVQGAVMYASGVTVGILVSRFAAKDAEIARLTAQLSPDVAVLVEALHEAELQIEYLHGRLGEETGSGNAVIARIRAALTRVKGGAA